MCQRTSHPTGFTLMEIMVALLVFGFGGAAVAALFPTAILCRERSVNDGVGTMICSNGLAVLKTRGTAADLPGALGPIVAEDDEDIVPVAQQHWPQGAEANMGFAALGERLAAADGTCRLILVAYHKSQAGQVRWRPVNIPGDYNAPTRRVDLPGGHPVREGTPLIWQATGEYAYVVRVGEDAGTPIAMLSREVRVPTNRTAYVLVEDKDGNLLSPAMRVLSARAELAP